MSRRNSQEEKVRRRLEREQRKENAAFIHEVAQTNPELAGKQVRFKNRKERRG